MKGADTASCDETGKAVRDIHQEFIQAGAGSAQAANIARSQLNMVLQNPDCFSARGARRGADSPRSDGQRAAGR